mgnify:FL=1
MSDPEVQTGTTSEVRTLGEVLREQAAERRRVHTEARERYTAVVERVTFAPGMAGRALRAVVELHRPTGAPVTYGSGVVVGCEGCPDDFTWGTNEWPCATFELVERETATE